MKKNKSIILLVGMILAISAGLFAQTEVTTGTDTTQLTSILEWVGSIVLFLIGHLAIKSKWTSVLHYVEVVLGWLYTLVVKINESTNRK